MKKITKDSEHIYTGAGRQRAVFKPEGCEFMLVKVDAPQGLPASSFLREATCPVNDARVDPALFAQVDPAVNEGKIYVTDASAICLTVGPHLSGHVKMTVMYA